MLIFMSYNISILPGGCFKTIMRKFLPGLIALLLFVPSIIHAEVALPAFSDIPAISLPASAHSGDVWLDNNTTLITLSDSFAAITGEGAVFGNSSVTILQSGSYCISGSSDNLSIVVDTAEEEKVTMILNGVDMNAHGSPYILVLNASKNVTIECPPDSVSILQSAFDSDIIATDGAYDAVIYSKEDLKFKHSGSLYLHSIGGKGINCRDDLSIQDTSLYIIADDDGLRGKDSVTINSGSVFVEAGADGIRSNNETDEGKGYISISGGTLYITAKEDGIHAHNDLSITDGRVFVKTAGGATQQQQSSGWPGKGGFGGGFGGSRGGFGSGKSTANETSTKGLKSETAIHIDGGEIEINSVDDAIHSNENAIIAGGQLLLKSNDDGIHAEKMLRITGGNIYIAQSYEGLESSDLQIAGGEIRLHASDDGINAAGAEKTVSSGNRGFGGGHGMLSSTSGTMQMTGGYVVIYADGDGVDVNGDAAMEDGVLLVYGPETSMNGALDYDGIFQVNGGMLLAVGTYGMAQSVTGSTSMPVMAFTCNIPANTILRIENSRGEPAITFASPKNYSCVIFTSSILETNMDYSVYADGVFGKEPLDGIYSDGEYANGTYLGTLSL